MFTAESPVCGRHTAMQGSQDHLLFNRGQYSTHSAVVTYSSCLPCHGATRTTSRRTNTTPVPPRRSRSRIRCLFTLAYRIHRSIDPSIKVVQRQHLLQLEALPLCHCIPVKDTPSTRQIYGGTRRTYLNSMIACLPSSAQAHKRTSLLHLL